MEDYKIKLMEFKEKTKDFFLNPYRDEDGTRLPGYNMPNVYAVLIAGFVGWLVLTLTFGTKLKATLKKLPVIGMLFPKAKRVTRARRMPVRRTARRRTYRGRK